MGFRLLAPWILVVLFASTVHAQLPSENLLLDLRSDSGVTLNSDHVTEWKDLSGNGNDAAQSDVAAEPSMASFFGRTGVHFPGWSYMRCRSVFPVHSDYTLIVVAHTSNFNAMTNFVSGETRALWLYNDRYPRVLHGDAPKQSICETPMRADSINLITVRFSEYTGQAKISVNGGREDSLYVGPNTDSILYVGAFKSSYFMQGDLFRIMLYQRELSKAELENVQSLLMPEYSIRRSDPVPGPDPTFSECPVNLQLYPRGEDDSATVRCRGALKAPNFDSIVLNVQTNGVSLWRQVTKLEYIDGKAAFTFTPRIHAELSEYSFELRAIGPGRDSLLRRVDSVTCGDVFLIDGQSNAIFGYDDSSYTNEFVRTFGVNFSHNLRDTSWALATAYKWGDGPSVSGWGQRITRDIMEQQHVPAVCINAGVSGTNIQSHRPDSLNRLDLLSIYGRMLYRLQKSGLDTAVRYIVWDQGELNYADHYHEYFTEMRQAWHQDLPKLQKIYVLQNRPNFCGWGNIDLRNVQWHLQDSFPDVESIATAALPFQDGCHYHDVGQNHKGDRLFRSITRDFYQATDTIGLRSPFLRSLRWADTQHTRLVAYFQTESPLQLTNDTVVNGSLRTLPDNIYLDDSTRVVSIAVDGSDLTLILAHPSTAKKLTYLADQYYNGSSDIYEGPWIVDQQGIGALLFYEFPIAEYSAVKPTSELLLSVWPDPADGTLNVSRADTTPGTIEITSSDGVRMMLRPWSAAEPNVLVLDVHTLPSGTYVIRYSSGGTARTAKFVLRP